MSISKEELFWALLIAAILGGSLAYLFWKQRKEVKEALKKRGESGGSAKKVQKEAAPGEQLQLQAYERLILLADRIALPNLISRINQPGLSGRDMQALLTLNIRQEFEHNITQQIYVSAEAWEAVRNLKDQNLLIVNQVSSFLPADCSGQDLCRSILEMLMQNPKASLHNIVSDALSFEAKKLLK